jgi:Flp pilus assembly protein TadG
MNPTKSVEKRPRRGDSGEALLEMALVLPILLVLSMGMLDFGRAFHAKSAIDQAAREGARVAVLSQPPDAAAAQARVADVLSANGIVGAPPATVSAVDPVTNTVTVTVTYSFKFVTPGLFQLVGASALGNDIAMTGQSVMRSENGN